MDNFKNSDTFFCKIADLITEIPTEWGLAPLCKNYMYNGNEKTDILISRTINNYSSYPWLTEEEISYIEAGRSFNSQLLYHNGFHLHSSAVELDGKAYLFSAPCGTGKSTHTRNWQKYFGKKAHVFNDDKPALRKIDGVWYAYGTPWCGKDHININMKAPLAGICFLKQAPHNIITRLTPFDAAKNIILQTTRRFREPERLNYMISNVNDVVSTVPVFELENLPNEEAVQLSYTTMLNAAKEAGL